MPDERKPSTVHLLCGLNGAGKTTYAQRLATESLAVRFTLDEWMLRLHGLPYDDPRYAAKAERCKEIIWDVTVQVLAVGVDVVLDWNQWSRERRALWRDKIVAAGHRPVLHYLQVPVETAIARADDRNRAEVRDAHVLDADAIRHLSEIFEPPTSQEGLELHTIDA